VPAPPGETPQTAAEFLSGPHDGLILSMVQIHRWCHLVRAKNGEKESLFALMPPPLDWEQVVRNDLDKKGPFDTVYFYELLRSDGALVFVLRSPDGLSAATDG
jgi:hypothetical protein